MLTKMKKAPILVPILVGARTVSAAVIGISALIGGNQSFWELSTQIDVGLGHLENSLSRQEGYVDSLVEVVLQN